MKHALCKTVCRIGKSHKLASPAWRRQGGGLFIAAIFFVLAVARAQAVTFDLYATPDSDAGYAWNSKYGPYGYTSGSADLGVGLYMGAPYGNDYTVGIIEIPISELQGGSLFSANLNVYSNGFGTGYYYGSAGLWWIAPTMPVTGNPVTDGVGSMLGGVSIEYSLWDSSVGQGAGWFSFDVTAHVQQDLDASRGFSTFILGGSRDTYGSIRAAEAAGTFGPMIQATGNIPEPLVCHMLAAGFALLGWRIIRRRAGEC